MTARYRSHPRPRRHRSPANRIRHDDQSWSARVADRVTALFGSWPFIIYQSLLILVWLAYNGYVAIHIRTGGAFDPYPFILLNLAFSTQAAYAAPLILLAGNRASIRDRMTLEHTASEADKEDRQNRELLQGNKQILEQVESLDHALWRVVLEGRRLHLNGHR